MTAAAVLATAGCSASGHSRVGGSSAGDQRSAASIGLRHAGPAIAAIRVVRAASDIRLPLDPYTLTPSQQQALSDGQNIAAHACLSRLGIHLPDRVFSPVTDYAHLPRYQLHFLSVASAERYGYSQSKQ